MNRTLTLGTLLTAGFALIAFTSLLWTPYPYTDLNIPEKLQSPNMVHLLGTDHLGRDILSMVMVGTRTSFAVALVALAIGLGFGVPLGLAAAARRGSALDEVIMRGNDIIFAFPLLVMAILITAVFGPSAINAIIAFGLFNIPVFARVTRGAALPLWEREFIMAGKAPARISVEHILPNVLNLLIVQATIQFALGIQVEAALSFVGLGVQPPTPSLGRMLADAQTLVTVAPHLAIVPGVAIILTVLGLNLLGDGLRDLLDPRLRHRAL